jgi:hypothetical protein
MSALLELLAGMKGAKFASFVYTAKPSGPRLTVEVAKHVLVLGASTHSLYLRDLEALAVIAPSLTGLEAEAAELIAESRRVSLAVGVGHNPAFTGIDTYTPTGVNGVKSHNETGELYVNGLAVSKAIITVAEYRMVNSKPLTLARAAVEGRLPSSKFRQFKLSGITVAKLNGETLELG